MEDSIRLQCAEVKVPHFTKGKKATVSTGKQYSSSHVRIHLERVIGFLHYFLAISMIICGDETDTNTVDKIVVVCCALCNVCDSIVNYYYYFFFFFTLPPFFEFQILSFLYIQENTIFF